LYNFLYHFSWRFFAALILWPVCVLAEDVSFSQDNMSEVIPPLPLKPFVGKTPLHLSCKDVLIGALTQAPSDPDGNLIYVMTYTFCMQELVLKTFLEYNQANHLNMEPILTKEINEALSAVSKMVYSLLWASRGVEVAFTKGELRQKLNKEQASRQQENNQFNSYSDE
jgi:hypothetical protein